MREARLLACVAGPVVAASKERLGQIGLIGGDVTVVVVGVLVTGAVAQISHQPGGGVAEVQRHGQGAVLLHVGQGAVVGGERGVTLGREREIERRFREGQEALRHADEMDGVLRGDRDGERARVRQSDIFRRQDDEAPRHEERVLAGLQHAGEPVERRVRIRAAQRLDERGNGVVVRVAGLVMGQAPLHDLLDECGRDRLLPARREDRGFEGAQGAARVAAGLNDDGVQRVRFNGRATPAQSPLAVVERALDEEREAGPAAAA